MTVNITSIPRGDENGLDKINANFEKVKTIDDGVTSLNQKDTKNFKIGKFVGGGENVDLNNQEQGIHTVGLWGEATNSSWPKSQQGSKISTWGMLLQMGAPTETCTQIMILFGAGLYYRLRVGGQWGDWIKLNGTADK